MVAADMPPNLTEHADQLRRSALREVFDPRQVAVPSDGHYQNFGLGEGYFRVCMTLMQLQNRQALLFSVAKTDPTFRVTTSLPTDEELRPILEAYLPTDHFEIPASSLGRSRQFVAVVQQPAAVAM